MTTIYASGPIDLDTSSNKYDWRTKLRAELETLGSTSVIFDPSKPFLMSMFGELDLDRSLFVEAVNDAALKAADVFILFLPMGIQTVGGITELELAIDNNKDIYIITNIPPGKSLYLDNRASKGCRVMWSTQEELDQSINTLAATLNKPKLNHEYTTMTVDDVEDM